MVCLEESQALAFVAGDLGDHARHGVEEHIDDCAACRQLLAELVRKRTLDPASDDTVLAGNKAPLFDPADWLPGMRVGRYVVLARIGRGGMGAVYRAEDVELARPVALKRLLGGADADSRARLVREARSAAQLQHPNVVTVHEVGEHAGTPFLAMELVDGVTLGAWLRERSRSWREIVGVVAQAGRGLIAAHERGLVHRDFKPDNVLVDRSGRARVADFGLARAGDAPPGDSGGIAHDVRLARMTATGSLAGTPAYLAPEIVDGGAPDARSDQYAFAITLWEALRGQHPFEGNTPVHMWDEMARGRIRPGGNPVPAWLDRHVRRGLEVDPAKRWPDVASFVAAIEKPPRRAQWLAAGAGVVAVGAAIAFVALRDPAGSSDPSCDDLANEFRVNVRDADLARAIPDATQQRHARNAIANFTTDYRTALRDSCRATRAGTQSPAIGDKRTACLELAKRRVWFVTSDIVTGNAKGLATQLDELPDPRACSDPEWLARASPLPVAQADRDALYRAESDLVNAGKLRDAGDLARASKLIASVNETAKRLNDRTLDARASLLASEIAHDRGDTEQAALDAQEAESAASVSGDTDLTLRAQLAMLIAVASHQKRAVEGFAGIGKISDSVDGAKLISSYGDALMKAGRFKEGEAQYRRAQAIREKLLPADHVERALGVQRIAAALVIQKRAAEALPLLQQAHPIVERAFPPLRREAIEGVRFFAMAEKELGHNERALELYREVHARRLKVHGAESLMEINARAEIAEVLSNLGRSEEAIRELEAAIAGFIAVHGERSVNAQDQRVILANLLISADRFAEADAALAKAVPALVRTKGADSPYALVAEYAQVRSYVERPKPIKLTEAARMLDRIEPVFAKTFGAKSHPVGAVLYSRARIAFAKRDMKAADALLAKAMPMYGDDNRTDRAEAELFHARVLHALGKRAEARASADASARDYEAAGPGYVAKAQASRAWAARTIR